MARSSILPVITLLLVATSSRAGKNDWSKACHDGECHYDVNGQTSGSISIAGAPHAISDITTAGGWTIIDCKPDTRIQDIRVVCSDEKCNHLYKGHGAVHTIVRLPENCTDAPFARVANEWKHSNQSIPDHIAAEIIKRDLTASVRGLALDTNFSAVDANATGNVTFAIEGTSQSGDTGNFTVTPTVSSRGLFSSLKHGIDSLNKITFDKNAAFPIKFDKTATLFDQSISCPQTGDYQLGRTSTDATLNFAVAASGKIIPPELTDFGLVAQLDGQIDGVITVNASAAATVTIDKKTLLTVGVPGLSVAGVLDIGPAFEVSASGNANLDTQANFGVNLAYTIDGAKLAFPPSAGSSGGAFALETWVTVSVAATPNAVANGAIDAHLIPAATFGIDAFDGAAQANINLALDTSSKLTLSLKAGSLDTGSAGTSGKAGSASGNFNGCAEVDAGLALFDIFDKSASVTLFQKNFNVLNKCFSGSGSTKKTWLTCPSVAGSVSNIASQVVASSNISPK
ncbi:hypothetical protein BC629DRAFT_1527098 [Irpex lacteus]|nr:hypothetical protein BC629DRAFT_1527098 [Irpex lacteus]